MKMKRIKLTTLVLACFVSLVSMHAWSQTLAR